MGERFLTKVCLQKIPFLFSLTAGVKHCNVFRVRTGAAAPGFNSLIPAPSVPSLTSTEQWSCFVELVIVALRILSASSNKKENRKRLKLSCSVLFTSMRSSSQRAQNENLRR